MPVIVLGQKLVAGLLALVFLFNLNIFKSDIKIDIFRHEETNNCIKFFGVIYADGKEGSIIVQMEEGNKETTINKNENSTITKDDKTPGKLKITIQNKNGEKVIIDHDYGSGEKSEFDKKIEQQVMDEVVNYIQGIKNKSLRERLFGYVNGFKNYCNRG